MKYLIAAVWLFSVLACRADEACDLAFAPDRQGMDLRENDRCGPFGGVAFEGVQARLLAKQLKTLEAILASQRELAKAVTDLTAATEKLSKASADLQTSNVTWRQQVLSSSLAEINRIPATMAANQDVIRALAASLATDAQFLKQVALTKN